MASQHERTTRRCRRHRCRCSVVADVICAERVCQLSSGRLIIAHVVIEASGGRVQEGLLHDDEDEAMVLVPHHVSSVAASLFVGHHSHHHRPCHPHPLLHHCCRGLPATLVIVAIALATLFDAALIIGHRLLLFVVIRCRACVHRPPSPIPLPVECCLFTPAVTAAVITDSVTVASATTITATAATVITGVVVNTTAINTAAATTAIAAADAVIAAAVIEGKGN